jgi:L-Ala-D/L-Glu epimerase
MRTGFHRKTLPLKDPFGISRSVSTEKHNIFVQIDDGIGEAAPNRFYGETPETVEAVLPQLLEVIEEDPFAIEQSVDNMEKCLKYNAAAKAAVEMALWDRLGKAAGQPLYKIWGLNAEKTPLSSFTIGLSETSDMIRKVKVAEEYPILKIKMGQPGDLEQLQAIREVTDKVIRIDANAAWTPKEALYKIDALAELGVEFIEQPLPPENVEGSKWLKERSRLPIIVDESCMNNASIPPLAAQCDGINIKLMKCAGLSEALRMIATARACGLQVMVGCMIESSVANTALAHLTPLVDYADLDGHVLIAEDPYRGLYLDEGKIQLPDGPGLGVEPRSGD